MRSARRTWLALAALTVAGAALRLPFLGLESLWYDEAFTLAVVEEDSVGDLWDRVRETESTPPLYYLLTWAWTQVVGSTGDAALRAPAALAGVLCVPASYLAARRLAGESIALAVAALGAASPVLVEYSLNARAYPLVVLFGCLSLWALGEAVERRGGRWLAAWALFAGLALWTHYYAGFLVAAELVALLWLLPGARARVALAGAGLVAACLPLLPLVGDQRDERASHIDRLALGERVEQAIRQLAAAPNPPSRLLEALAIALAIGGLAAGAWFAPRHRRGPALLGALGAAAVSAPLVLAVAGIDDHFFMRNLLVAWACMATVAAVGLTRARGIPLAGALLVGLALVIGSHADWRHHNADWDGALDSLGPEAIHPIVVMPGIDHVVPNAYLRRPVAAGSVTAEVMWVMVEPGRANRADLEELDGFPRAVPPGFRRTATRSYRGFRMIRFEAPVPTEFNPASFGPDQIGLQAITLVPRP